MIDKNIPKERQWTPRHDEILLQLRGAGLTLPVIGERLGRTAYACSSRVTRLLGEEPEILPPKDYLGERIDAYMARIARLNRMPVDVMQRVAYGWR